MVSELTPDAKPPPSFSMKTQSVTEAEVVAIRAAPLPASDVLL
jgi:hypothetical protein